MKTILYLIFSFVCLILLFSIGQNQQKEVEICDFETLKQFLNNKKLEKEEQNQELSECNNLYQLYQTRKEWNFPEIEDGILDLNFSLSDITDVQFLDLIKIAYISYTEYEGTLEQFYIDMFHNQITSMEKQYEIIGEMYGIEILSFNMGMNQITTAKGIEFIQKLNLKELYVWTEHNSQTTVEPLYALLDFDSLDFLIVALDGNYIPEKESKIWRKAIITKFPFAEKLIFI